jgi:hypothetical protein
MDSELLIQVCFAIVAVPIIVVVIIASIRRSKRSERARRWFAKCFGAGCGKEISIPNCPNCRNYDWKKKNPIGGGSSGPGDYFLGDFSCQVCGHSLLSVRCKECGTRVDWEEFYSRWVPDS